MTTQAFPAAPPPPAPPVEPPRSAPRAESGKGRAGSPSRPQQKKKAPRKTGAEPKVRTEDLKHVFATADGNKLTVREAAEALAELLGVECTKSICTRVGIALCECKAFESQGKGTGIYALTSAAPTAPRKSRADLLTAPLQDLTEEQLLERATKEDESGNATAFLATRKELMKRRAAR